MDEAQRLLYEGFRWVATRRPHFPFLMYAEESGEVLFTVDLEGGSPAMLSVNRGGYCNGLTVLLAALPGGRLLVGAVSPLGRAVERDEGFRCYVLSPRGDLVEGLRRWAEGALGGDVVVAARELVHRVGVWLSDEGCWFLHPWATASGADFLAGRADYCLERCLGYHFDFLFSGTIARVAVERRLLSARWACRCAFTTGEETSTGLCMVAGELVQRLKWARQPEPLYGLLAEGVERGTQAARAAIMLAASA